MKKLTIIFLISLIIAFPLGFYFGKEWLQNFAYRTTIDWWIFALAGLAALAIALLTVSYHTIKAARANPVKSLKYE